MTEGHPEAAPQPAASLLEGVRVLSLAEQYPGPLATMVLADLGADVILIERPQGGDPTRRFPGHFEGLNRGKRSVAVDLKTSAGTGILWELIATADVLIEGYRPGVIQRLGFSAEAVRARHPALVYCSISAFGQTGPLSERASHDLTSQGIAGFVVGDESPSPAPLPLADISSGMFAIVGVLTALYSRQRCGKGSTVDVAMLDSLLSWRSSTLAASLNSLDPAPYPPEDPGYGVFRTRDGSFVTLSIAGEDHHWRALCEVLGLADLGQLTTVEREASRSIVEPILRQSILRADPALLASLLAEAGVALGPVNNDEEVASDDQVLARQLIVRTPSGARVVRQPIVFDGLRSAIPAGAPQLGQHTEEILLDAGYSHSDIVSLLDSGVLACSGPPRQ